MGRRFLERLQKRIEGGIGDLVGFVEDVNLKTIPGRTISGGFPQLTNLVNSAVRCRIDFDNIYRISGPDLSAGITHPTGLWDGVIRGATVQGHGEYASDCGFSDSPVTAEDISVRGPPLLDGILQGLGNVLLSDNLGEFLGAVLARQDLIAHGKPDYT
jgi:hypothetical protein